MPLPSRAWLILLLAPAMVQAQGWANWYSAYEEGLEAQRQGDLATALKAFQSAAALNPTPGNRVKTYGLNFMDQYFPYLKQAECALGLGQQDTADKALQASARIGKEPSTLREALQARLAKAREAAQPKENPRPPAPTPAPTQPPPTTTAIVPVRPAPVEPARAAQTTPSPVPPTLVQAPPPKPSSESPKKGAPIETGSTTVAPAPPQATVPPIAAPSKEPATPPPATLPAAPPPKPLNLAWLGAGAILVLAGAGGGLLLARRRRDQGHPQRIHTGGTTRVAGSNPGRSNPYRVDLNANTGGGTRVSHSASPDATVGHRRVGPYVITKVLGRGGCATTYLAVNEDDGTEVAVKIPHPHIVIDPDFLARFRREAELGAVLDHPRIVRILDPGPKEGDAWIAMTLVRGTTMESFLASHKGPLSIAEVVHMASEIAEAIAYAHSKGVVHRDLKPANVMLGESGAQVMDFGIARLLDASITSTAVFIGTPNYAAPEALINPRVGPPADRYALGILLFEMLAGEVPFKAETGFQVLDMHRSMALPDIRALRPDAPPRLARLVERLCMKDPALRPEDGEVLHFLSELKVEFPLVEE